ncbi:MAG TPA: hypothetical protein VN836_04605 [Verrucomicrobiae bacterium]|nr:hypothetical protein [Verrucomicrobiae bacterium]
MKIIPLAATLFCGLFFIDENAHAQTNLECIGHVNDSPWGAFDVAVAGHYVFLANGSDGLRIYDVSTPTNPICVGHAKDGGVGASAMGVALFGDYAYIANSNDGMRIYDVSDPTHPINVGRSPEIASPAASFGIAISGVQQHRAFAPIRSWLFGKRKSGARYAFLANYNDGLRIYDVSNPAKPKRIGRVNDGGTALYAAVSGKYVFLANDYDGLRVYDVSNPASPTNVARVKDMGYPWGVAVAGKYAYVADNFYGFSIFDISDVTHPVGVGHINDSPPPLSFIEAHSHTTNSKTHIDGSAYGIAVAGNHAYLANFGDGVRVYDISNPTNPINIAHTATNYQGFSKRIAVSRGFAFVANANDGLRIYKVWDDTPTASEFPVYTFAVIALSLILIVVAISIWRFKVSSAKHEADNSS